jgi:hypothetical protein
MATMIPAGVPPACRVPAGGAPWARDADLGSGIPAFIVAGPGGSGRSTILVTMARSFLAAGTRVLIAAPRPPPLRSLAEAVGVERVFTGRLARG